MLMWLQVSTYQCLVKKKKVILLVRIHQLRSCVASFEEAVFCYFSWGFLMNSGAIYCRIVYFSE